MKRSLIISLSAFLTLSMAIPVCAKTVDVQAEISAHKKVVVEKQKSKLESIRKDKNFRILSENQDGAFNLTNFEDAQDKNNFLAKCN